MSRSYPQGATILEMTKVMLVMGMVCLAVIGQAKPIPKLDVVGESPPVEVGLTPSKYVKIMGSKEVLDFNNFVILPSKSRETSNITETDLEIRIWFRNREGISKGEMIREM